MTDLPRTDSLEAKDRNDQGQDQGLRHKAEVFSKKKAFAQIIANFPQNSSVLQKKRVFKNFSQGL